MTQPADDKKTRLNVAVDDALHRDLRVLSVQLAEPLTVLVPRLLRAAVTEEKKRLAGS